MAISKHVFSFSMVGGVKRVNIESGKDLEHLSELDPKLWTALSCPVNDLEIDKKTLQLIDADKDNQIRVPDVLGAVGWMVLVLKNSDDLLKQSAEFPISAIDDSTEEGKVLLESAKVVLKNLGKEDTDILTVEDTSDTEKIFAGTRFNGDGIITEDSTADESLTAVLNDIMLYAGSVTDRGGKPGITQELLEIFADESRKYLDWQEKKDNDLATVMPFGEGTEDAYNNYLALKDKVDDYFIRCRLAAFDPQSTEVLNLQTARVETITANDLSKSLDEIATYPLARVTAAGHLPVDKDINPAWESIMATFRLTVHTLFPGKESITEAEWDKIGKAFAGFAEWNAAKEGASVAALGMPRIRELLSGNALNQLSELLEQDIAVESEANNIIIVDKLVRLYRDLFKLLKNFVTFYDFYAPGSMAIFQAGVLYIDQRSCDLCIKVTDMSRQAILASFSGMYLIYCDCVSKATNEKMTIVAALTNGDIDDLMVGRNALFYDRKGLDWDATIIKITDNPISIRQAFFSPYRKLSRLIETQVNKAAAAQDEKASANMAKGVDAVPGKIDDAKAKKDPPPPFDVGKFAGIFAAIGLAVAAIGGIISNIGSGFMKLEWWKMPLAILGLLLLISGPSMILAYLKLRKRNLAPLLDANGWAINARVKINLHFGRTLTHLAELPKGAKININDPFAEKKKPILPVMLVLLAIAAVALYLLQKHGYIHLHL